jgi:hypothetical protein
MNKVNKEVEEMAFTAQVERFLASGVPYNDAVAMAEREADTGILYDALTMTHEERNNLSDFGALFKVDEEAPIPADHLVRLGRWKNRKEIIEVFCTTLAAREDYAAEPPFTRIVMIAAMATQTLGVGLIDAWEVAEILEIPGLTLGRPKKTRSSGPSAREEAVVGTFMDEAKTRLNVDMRPVLPGDCLLPFPFEGDVTDEKITEALLEYISKADKEDSAFPGDQ